MIDVNQIDSWFTYQAPDADKTKLYETVRAHARQFAHVLNHLVPDGADKTTAIRTLREAVMWANAAIALGEATTPARAFDAGVTTTSRSPYQTSEWPAPVAGLAPQPKHQREPDLHDLVSEFGLNKTGSAL